MFVFLPVSRSIISSVTYIFGNNSPSIQWFNEYSIASRSATLSPVVFEASSAFIGTNAFIFGGGSTGPTATHNTIQRFDGSSRTTDGAVLGALRRRTVAGNPDGNAYVLGGDNGDAVGTKTNYKYNGSTVTTAAALQQQIRSTAAAVLSNLIFTFTTNLNGGSPPPTNTAIQRFNSTSNTTSVDSAIWPAASAASLMAAGTIGSNMFVVGGFTGSAGNTAIRKYDGTTITTESATLALQAFGHCASSTGTRINIFGGTESATLRAIQTFNGTVCTNTAFSLLSDSASSCTPGSTLNSTTFI